MIIRPVQDNLVAEVSVLDHRENFACIGATTVKVEFDVASTRRQEFEGGQNGVEIFLRDVDTAHISDPKRRMIGQREHRLTELQVVVIDNVNLSIITIDILELRRRAARHRNYFVCFGDRLPKPLIPAPPWAEGTRALISSSPRSSAPRR